MYALANVRKFVEDNGELLGDRAKEILKRAEEASYNGVISGSSIEEIMRDNVLASEFHKVAMTPDYLGIGLSALRTAY